MNFSDTISKYWTTFALAESKLSWGGLEERVENCGWVSWEFGGCLVCEYSSTCTYYTGQPMTRLVVMSNRLIVSQIDRGGKNSAVNAASAVAVMGKKQDQCASDWIGWLLKSWQMKGRKIVWMTTCECNILVGFLCTSLTGSNIFQQGKVIQWLSLST